MAGEAGSLSAMPGPLRERVELVEETLEEAPHPFIYRVLMDEGTKHVIEEYRRKKASLKARGDLAERAAAFLGVRKADVDLVKQLSDAFGSGELKVVGVDAGVNYLNLEVAYVPLCCAIAALCSAYDVLDYAPRVLERVPLWDDEIYPEWRTLVVSYRLQFELVE